MNWLKSWNVYFDQNTQRVRMVILVRIFKERGRFGNDIVGITC